MIEYNLAILIPLMKANDISVNIDNIEEIHRIGEESLYNGRYCNEYEIMEICAFLLQ